MEVMGERDGSCEICVAGRVEHDERRGEKMMPVEEHEQTKQTKGGRGRKVEGAGGKKRAQKSGEDDLSK